MKVYRITIMDNDEGTCYVWAGSKREVRKRARRMLDDMGREGDSLDEAAFCPRNGEIVEQVSVTADWLHSHFTRDNG